MFRSKPVDISKLSPLRRGFVLGYRRARHKARAEMRDIAAHWEAEVIALQHDYREIALELHRDHYDRAVDEAIVQREKDADIVLH
jgi:hypothetical protein